MNTLFGNSYLTSRESCHSLSNGAHKKNQYQTDSLLGLALYDFDCFASDVGHLPPPRQNPRTEHVGFHPVDEYKDLTLKEILDLSDDIIMNDDVRFQNNSLQYNDFAFNSNAFPFNNIPQLQLHPTMMTPLESSTMSHPHEQGLSLSFDPQQMMFQNQQALSKSLYPPRQPQQELPAVMASSDFKKRSSDTEHESTLENCNEDTSETDRRFRPYQAGQWSEKFIELCNFKDKTGHCLVPYTYQENLALARWVKRQRYQYKLMLEQKATTMTAERVKALDEIGFVWDSQGAAWGDRLGELQQFRQLFKHCNVPSNYFDNPRLATWIKCQRRQYKLYIENKPSNMTSQRIQHLTSLGFEWGLRAHKKQRVE
jgi:Helicase associated domain